MPYHTGWYGNAQDAGGGWHAEDVALRGCAAHGALLPATCAIHRHILELSVNNSMSSAIDAAKHKLDRAARVRRIKRTDHDFAAIVGSSREAFKRSREYLRKIQPFIDIGSSGEVAIGH